MNKQDQNLFMRKIQSVSVIIDVSVNTTVPFVFSLSRGLLNLLKEQYHLQ